MLQIEEYQQMAHMFADYKGMNKGDFTYPALGLTEEAGEVAGKFAKAVRDNNGKLDDKRREDIKKELGDVCWFISELSTLLGFSLEGVMRANLDKLRSRQKRGVIHGEGDDR